MNDSKLDTDLKKVWQMKEDARRHLEQVEKKLENARKTIYLPGSEFDQNGTNEEPTISSTTHSPYAPYNIRTNPVMYENMSKNQIRFAHDRKRRVGRKHLNFDDNYVSSEYENCSLENEDVIFSTNESKKTSPVGPVPMEIHLKGPSKEIAKNTGEAMSSSHSDQRNGDLYSQLQSRDHQGSRDDVKESRDLRENVNKAKEDDVSRSKDSSDVRENLKSLTLNELSEKLNNLKQQTGALCKEIAQKFYKNGGESSISSSNFSSRDEKRRENAQKLARNSNISLNKRVNSIGNGEIKGLRSANGDVRGLRSVNSTQNDDNSNNIDKNTYVKRSNSAKPRLFSHLSNQNKSISDQKSISTQKSIKSSSENSEIDELKRQNSRKIELMKKKYTEKMESLQKINQKIDEKSSKNRENDRNHQNFDQPSTSNNAALPSEPRIIRSAERPRILRRSRQTVASTTSDPTQDEKLCKLRSRTYDEKEIRDFIAARKRRQKELANGQVENKQQNIEKIRHYDQNLIRNFIEERKLQKKNENLVLKEKLLKEKELKDEKIRNLLEKQQKFRSIPFIELYLNSRNTKLTIFSEENPSKQEYVENLRRQYISEITISREPVNANFNENKHIETKEDEYFPINRDQKRLNLQSNKEKIDEYNVANTIKRKNESQKRVNVPPLDLSNIRDGSPDFSRTITLSHFVPPPPDSPPISQHDEVFQQQPVPKNGPINVSNHVIGQKSASNHVAGQKSTSNHVAGQKSTSNHVTGQKSTSNHVTGQNSTSNHVDGQKSTYDHVTGPKNDFLRRSVSSESLISTPQPSPSVSTLTLSSPRKSTKSKMKRTFSYRRNLHRRFSSQILTSPSTADRNEHLSPRSLQMQARAGLNYLNFVHDSLKQVGEIDKINALTRAQHENHIFDDSMQIRRDLEQVRLNNEQQRLMLQAEKALAEERRLAVTEMSENQRLLVNTIISTNRQMMAEANRPISLENVAKIAAETATAVALTVLKQNQTFKKQENSPKNRKSSFSSSELVSISEKSSQKSKSSKKSDSSSKKLDKESRKIDLRPKKIDDAENSSSSIKTDIPLQNGDNSDIKTASSVQNATADDLSISNDRKSIILTEIQSPTQNSAREISISEKIDNSSNSIQTTTFIDRKKQPNFEDSSPKKAHSEEMLTKNEAENKEITANLPQTPPNYTKTGRILHDYLNFNSSFDDSFSSFTFSDATEMESRIKALKSDLQEKKNLAEKLKQECKRRAKERFINTEESLLKQKQAYDKYIEEIQTQLKDLEHESTNLGGAQNRRPSLSPRIMSPRAGPVVSSDTATGSESNTITPRSPVSSRKLKSPLKKADLFSPKSDLVSQKSINGRQKVEDRRSRSISEVFTTKSASEESRSASSSSFFDKKSSEKRQKSDKDRTLIASSAEKSRKIDLKNSISSSKSQKSSSKSDKSEPETTDEVSDVPEDIVDEQSATNQTISDSREPNLHRIDNESRDKKPVFLDSDLKLIDPGIRDAVKLENGKYANFSIVEKIIEQIFNDILHKELIFVIDNCQKLVVKSKSDPEIREKDEFLPKIEGIQPKKDEFEAKTEEFHPKNDNFLAFGDQIFMQIFQDSMDSCLKVYSNKSRPHFEPLKSPRSTPTPSIEKYVSEIYRQPLPQKSPDQEDKQFVMSKIDLVALLDEENDFDEDFDFEGYDTQSTVSVFNIKSPKSPISPKKSPISAEIKFTTDVYSAIPVDNMQIRTIVKYCVDKLYEHRSYGEPLTQATVPPDLYTIEKDGSKDTTISRLPLDKESDENFREFFFDYCKNIVEQIFSDESESIKLNPESEFEYIAEKLGFKTSLNYRNPNFYTKFRYEKNGRTKDHVTNLLINQLYSFVNKFKGSTPSGGGGDGPKNSTFSNFSTNFGREKFVSRKKLDTVDEILLPEIYAEEFQWTNYDEEELKVKLELYESVWNMLMEDSFNAINLHKFRNKT